MSTEIKATSEDHRDAVRVGPSQRTGGVLVSVTRGPFGSSAVPVPRADFLKAVADELDVIVVEKAEPLAEWERELLATNVQGADDARAMARAYLALAEYLDANPPTDPKVEAQVERIAEAVRAEDIARGINVGMRDAYLPMARSLYRGGVRVEVTP